MSAALWVALAWIVLSVVVGVWVGLILRARDAHERPVPAFRFGSGPLAGVGLYTSRPWVQR